MHKTIAATIAASALCLVAGLGAAFAGEATWTLDPAASKVAFGSIKKDKVGESHHFTGLTGQVDGGGNVVIEIDLSSVETWIDIRNERMIEHVFNSLPVAKLAARVPMDALGGVETGGMKVIDVTGMLEFGPASVPVETSLVVARLGEDRVLAVTDEMIFISAEDAGIDAGVSMLQEIADLPGITRAVPVTLRLVFDRAG